MSQLYEGMFLLDNELVRAGWNEAKARVRDLLQKHGGTLRAARRWDERKLAYPIKRRTRATYLLAYFELGPDAGPALVRDLELNDDVLRHIIVRTDALPHGETERAAAEESADFVVPEPPEEAAPPPPPAEEPAAKGDSGSDEKAAKGDSGSEEKAAKGDSGSEEKAAKGDSGSDEKAAKGDSGSDEKAAKKESESGDGEDGKKAGEPKAVTAAAKASDEEKQA